MNSKVKIKVAILQRVCANYRLTLFRQLAANPDLDIRLFLGEDLPNSKVKSVKNIEGVAHEKLGTQVLRLGRRLLVNHKGLIGRLSRYSPDIIICEGESNFLSYLKAILYRVKNRRVRLVLWTQGGRPGKKRHNRVMNFLRRFLWHRFHAFITYSSYGRDRAIEFGIAEEKIHVATNVCDTAFHLQKSRSIGDSKVGARKRLGIDQDCFMTLYIGATDRNKRLEALIDAATIVGRDSMEVFVVGDGESLDSLKRHAHDVSATNVTFTGRIVDNLPYYFKAADVFVMPGMGGILLSECMAYQLPIIVYQADGTEYDLVEHGKTGIRLSNGSPKEIADYLSSLLNQREQLAQWGREAQKRIVDKYNTKSQAQSLTRCINQLISMNL
jgi:glycosyltransferase involved in cell wall biosynthesis